MPFVSKVQARYLFATNPEIAKEFATHTDFSKLPERKGLKKTKRPSEKAEAVKSAAERIELFDAFLSCFQESPSGDDSC